MKVLFFAVMCCFVFVGSVFAAPFVVADVQGSDIDRYLVSLNGGTYTEVAATTVSGGKQFRYDIAPLSNGTYILKAKACNIYTCSVDSAPFTFSKTVPSAPTGLRLEF